MFIYTSTNLSSYVLSKSVRKAYLGRLIIIYGGNMFLKMTKALLLLMMMTMISLSTAMAQSSIYGAKEGPAIEGYDTVAYFTQAKPVKGDAQFSVEWKNATWLFSNKENRDLFQAEPEKYAPQYGAHCAFAMAKDMFASGDPLRWRIVDGKLFLNTNAFAQWLWEKDIPEYIKEANSYWPEKLTALEKKN